MNYLISIIIPVFNESQIINSTIDYLYNLDFTGNVEIIVVDGNPAGTTINTITNTDVQKVIGKKGRNVNAIRDILNSVAAKDRKRVTLEILE